MTKILLLKKRTNMLAFGLLLLLSGFNLNAQCSLTGWSKISQGENFSVALKQDGTLWVWGRNLYGLLGDGTGAHTEIQHPTQIGTDTDWTDIAVGRFFALGKKANGDLYGWGANDYGQLGLGHNANVFAPTLIQQNVSAFSAGYFHTLIVKTNGTLWGTGYNDWSGLGVGTSVLSYNTFQQEVGLATNWASVRGTYYNSFAIKTDGTLWTAGANVEGQTGLGTPSSLGANETAVFTQIGTDTNWKAVAGGMHHTLGLKTNGELWSWGRSLYGNLGLGNTTQHFTPQQIAGTNWSAIGGAEESSCALQTDGSLWVWGSNEYGKLGIGTTADMNIPTKVGTEDNWQSIPAKFANSFVAIKSDTSLFSWGADTYWQLSNIDGTQTGTRVPGQVTCTNDLSVGDFVNAKFSVYPNPAKDNLFLKSAQSIDEVKIYSLNGALVKTVLNVENETAINVSGLASGIYIMKVNNQSQGIKLVKE